VKSNQATLRASVQASAVIIPIAGMPRRGESARDVYRRLRGAWNGLVARNEATIREELRMRAPLALKVRSEMAVDLHAGRRLKFVPNCSLVLVGRSGRSTRCGLVGLCPYCWIREVGAVWDRVAGVVAPRPAPGAPRECSGEYDLVLATREFALPGTVRDFFRERVAGASLRGAAAIPPRRCEFRRLRFVGAYEVAAAYPKVVPVEGGEATRLVGVVRQLLAVRRGEDPGPWATGPGWPEVSVRRFDGATLGDAAKAVAALCRYPSGLLRKPGESEERAHGRALAAVLAARRGVRAWASFGAFREKDAPAGGGVESRRPQ